MLEMLSSSQPSVTFRADGRSKPRSLRCRSCASAQAESRASHRKSTALLRMRVERILRDSLRYRSRRSCAANRHCAYVVERFGPRVARLQARPAMPHRAGQRSLQRVIGGVRVSRNHGLEPEAARDGARAVEDRVAARTPGRAPGIPVGKRSAAAQRSVPT